MKEHDYIIENISEQLVVTPVEGEHTKYYRIQREPKKEPRLTTIFRRLRVRRRGK